MKSSFTLFCLPLLVLTACGKDFMRTGGSDSYDDSAVQHDEIVLGNQLDNPYSLSNVKSAFESLYPAMSSAYLTSTHTYMRFLPRTSEELDALRKTGISILDHPMDYEIVREGDWYHDPDINENNITWQYAIVPNGTVLPQNIRKEPLQDCYIMDADTPSKAYPDVDWAAVEREAFRITGNSAMLGEDDGMCLKSGTTQPSGRIAIIDDDYNGGQPLGVPGVKVECNVFVKFSSAYTDGDGYYRIPKKFTNNPRYRIVFSNEQGYSIGFNTILYKGSVSTLGRNSVSGVNVTVRKDSDRKLFRRCVANNAVYDYIRRCRPEDLSVLAPPSGLCLWMFESTEASSAVMLHHGTVLSDEYSNKYFSIAASVIKLFGPDITVGCKNGDTYKSIYSSVIHELAHASHFAKVGVEYWNRVITFIVNSAISGAGTYGDASMADSGYCAVSEMWAYYIASKLYKERYGGSNPMFGSKYWFHPQVLTYLESRGVTPGQIFEAMDKGVCSQEGLRDRLIELNPSRRAIINQVFNRYE